MCVARHADWEAMRLVVYRSEQNGSVWARPVGDFMGMAWDGASWVTRFAPITPDERITTAETPLASDTL